MIYNPGGSSSSKAEESRIFLENKDMSAERSTSKPDRSRSRSITRSVSENLLVSLDESILPPQITKVRNEIRTDSLGIPKVSHEKLEHSESQEAAKGPVEKKPSLSAGQHPDITNRYSKREIISIFKGLGRF